MALLNEQKGKAYPRPTGSPDMMESYQDDLAGGFPGQEKRGSTQLQNAGSIMIAPELHQGPQTLDSPMNPNILVQKIMVREHSEKQSKQEYIDSSGYASRQNMDLADATNCFSSIHQVNQHHGQSIIS